MRAFVIDSSAQLGRVRLASIDQGQPASGEVCVQLRAVSLNPVDNKLIQSGHPAWRYPHVPGVDGAGVVTTVGPDVSVWQPGDRVYFHTNLTRDGTFAEYVTVPGHVLARVPDHVAWTSAAALPCAGFTAYHALNRRLHLGVGQTILIHGGSGGVGGYAIQFAKLCGAVVLATCSAANRAHVLELGADVAIDYAQDDLAAAVMEATAGRGVHAVLDTVSSDSATRALGLLRFNGQLAFIAGAPDYSQARSLRRGLSFHDVTLGGAYASGDFEAQQDLARMGTEVMELLATNRIRDNVTLELPFEQLPEGLTRLNTGKVRGKIVCVV